MIERKKKPCKGCGKPSFIWSKGFCKYCAPQKKYVYKRKATGEREVFLQIWEEREHICEHCCDQLGDEPLAQFFSHKKSKKTYPELRLLKEWIDLFCFDCHYCRDHGTQAQFDARKDLYKK